jgi:hypothetical protein
LIEKHTEKNKSNGIPQKILIEMEGKVAQGFTPLGPMAMKRG